MCRFICHRFCDGGSFLPVRLAIQISQIQRVSHGENNTGAWKGHVDDESGLVSRSLPGEKDIGSD